MSAAEQETSNAAGGREWLWRFLAVAMFAATAWVIWVALQLSPRGLATPAAFEAASRAAAHRAAGRIAEVPAGTVPEPAAMAKELAYPPVDLSRLKRSETLSDAALKPAAAAAVNRD